MTTVRVHFPAGHLGFGADDSSGDLALRIIGVAFGDENDWPSKYGATYENDVFLMRPYCWCEADDCRWCSEDACGCPHPAPEWFFDGAPIDDWCAVNDRLLARFHKKNGDLDYEAIERDKAGWDAAIAERDARLVTVWPSRSHSCEPQGLMADRPRGDTHLPSQAAPNFWYKPTGLRVWWYKYIGRSTEVDGTAPADMLERIFATHPSGMTLDEAIAEYARRAEASAKAWDSMIAQLNRDLNRRSQP